MVVQHNLTAMNSNRMLGVTTKSQAKSTEKLSSGYKINRAADDAAGLSISEKMRKQIRGLTQASANAQDGISSVQTAEGALNEVQDMLQRMNELATKAANGTMSENDRSYVQNEIDQLVTEIDRVAETTKFNETYLLKGTDNTTTKTLAAHDAGFAGKLTDNGDGTSTFALDKELEDGNKISIAGKEYTIGDSASTSSTKGYGVSTDVSSKKVSVGDTVKTTAGTATLVNKIAVADAANWEEDTRFIVEDEKGNKTEYTIAAATDLAAKQLKATDVAGFLADHLKNPAHKVTVSNWNDGAGNDVSVEMEVVDTLGTNEKSILSKAGGDLTTATVNNIATALTGDLKEVTIGGEKTTILAKPPVSSSDIAEIVNSMKAGDRLKLNTTTITIADKTDIQNNQYSVEDALKAINNDAGDMDQIEFDINASNATGTKILADKGLTSNTALTGAHAVTVVGVPTGAKGSDVISKADAYRMMADELQKASSIGTDEGKEAAVVNNNDGTFKITQGTAEVKEAITLNLHVGADADTTNKISVSIDTMSASGLGVKGLDVTDKTGTDATYAIDAIADAIQKVSTQRSALGAVQNRLEHTIANLDNVVENTTSAESAIRDTDMASEMVKYSNNNILAQAGQSMLAQANQSNQGVLSLLG